MGSLITIIAFLVGLVTSQTALWDRKIISSVEFSSIDFASQFNDWKSYFDKSYVNTQHEMTAFETWKSNWKMINKWNNNNKNSYTLKINQFSDLTTTQFKSKYTVTKGFEASIKNKKRFGPVANGIQNLPDSIDWSNITGPVQNQGQMGDNVGLAVATCLAGFESVSVGKLTATLSVKELTDCVKPIITPNNCWQFIVNNTGLCSKSSYTPVASGECEKDKCSPIDSITSYIDVDAVNNSTALQYALLGGPVVIGVEADQSAFQSYASGILNKGCGDNIDHYMVVVGYGIENGNKYWKCQNSWGASWGQNGFILLCRDCNQNNGNGICGILKDPSFPVLA